MFGQYSNKVYKNVANLLKHCFDISLQQSKSKGCANTCRDQVQQSRLGVAIDMHNKNGGEQTRNVCQERSVEIGSRVPVHAKNKTKKSTLVYSLL
jgi:hypothetical protein